MPRNALRSARDPRNLAGQPRGWVNGNLTVFSDHPRVNRLYGRWLHGHGIVLHIVHIGVSRGLTEGVIRINRKGKSAKDAAEAAADLVRDWLRERHIPYQQITIWAP